MRSLPTYILSFLATYNGGVCVFKLDPTTKRYKYIDYIQMPKDQYKHADVVGYKNNILNLIDSTEPVTAFIVKAQYRETDDIRCIYRIGVHTSISTTLANLLGMRIYNIKNPMLWQDYFNLDHDNTKEAALIKAKELLPDTPIESTEQAEAILIGVYGIETVIKKKILTKSIEYYKSIPANALIDFSVMK